MGSLFCDANLDILCSDLSCPGCFLHQNILPTWRVFPVIRTSLSLCIWLWTSHLGMVVAPTHQELHISCTQRSHLLAVENYRAFRVGNRRLAFGEVLRRRVEKAELNLMAQISCPKNVSRPPSGRYRYLACRTLAHCVGWRLCVDCCTFLQKLIAIRSRWFTPVAALVFAVIDFFLPCPGALAVAFQLSRDISIHDRFCLLSMGRQFPAECAGYVQQVWGGR